MEQQQAKSGVTFRNGSLPSHSVSVLIGDRVVGHINRTRGGFVYAPKGSTLRGDVFPSLDACKASLAA
jgi:hypothetical protein